MKKQLMVLGAVFAAMLLAGCAGVGFSNGAPVPVAAGPNFFSNVKVAYPPSLLCI